MGNSTLYRGYELIVEIDTGHIQIYKKDKLVHTTNSHKSAYAWIDKKVK